MQHTRCKPAAGRFDIPTGQVDDCPAGLGQAASYRQKNANGIVALHQQLPDGAEILPLMMVAYKGHAERPESLALFRKTFRQKCNGSDAVSVVDRYGFQRSLPLSGVVSGREGFFNSTAQYRHTMIDLPSR